MAPAALLELGAELMRQVLAFEAPADGCVAAFFRRHPALGKRERQALADTVYAVLRLRLRYEHAAARGPGALPRRLVLLAWQGEAEALARALDAAEREWLAEAQRAFENPPPSAALRHNLPTWIAEPLEQRLGGAEFEALAASLLQPAPLDLRVNVLQARREAVQAALAEAGLAAQPTPWSPWGLRLEGKPALGPGLQDGRFEVQDEGSQLLALVVQARRGETVVDFCAGAGGKTLALGAAMRNTGRLYAFDTSGHRLAALEERLPRSGLDNVHLARLAHERDERVARLAGKVDRVLVDAPCSGLGTLRRNPDLKWRQTPETVREFTGRQAAILAAAARLVKPGGRLVYATCSLLASESEDIADAFEAAHTPFAPLSALDALRAAKVPRPEGLVEGTRLRLWPHRHGSDGFFAALWTRR